MKWNVLIIVLVCNHGSQGFQGRWDQFMNTVFDKWGWWFAYGLCETAENPQQRLHFGILVLRHSLHPTSCSQFERKNYICITLPDRGQRRSHRSSQSSLHSFRLWCVSWLWSIAVFSFTWINFSLVSIAILVLVSLLQQSKPT